MHAFTLERTTDISGCSGEGRVAEGVRFTNGTCVLSWFAGRAGAQSIGVYQSLADVLRIHGHRGSTRAVFRAE